MLKYMIQVVSDLLVTGILVGMLSAFIVMTDGEQGKKTVRTGFIIGIIVSVIMAIYKNVVYHVDSNIWNLRILIVSLIAAVLFFALSGRKKAGEGKAKLHRIASVVLMATWMLYALPNVLGYPFNFDLANSSVLSTDFFYRLIGWIFGLAIVVVAGIFARFLSKQLDISTLKKVLYILIIVNMVCQASVVLRVLLSKRLIPSNKALFSLMTTTYNHSDFFIYLSLIIAAAIPVILWIRSVRQNEPYDNPAQRRRIKSVWRKRRIGSVVLIICFVLGVLNLTVVRAADEREVELSPSEECEVRDGGVYVSLEQVADGHLHRFTYVTDNGVGVRFIVIKKPNSSSYGIGLDACDVCGETGYFERNGQVVCKLCDVVMNINTIGFKGGCNPIPVSYSVENGYIVLSTAELTEHEAEFK